METLTGIAIGIAICAFLPQIAGLVIRLIRELIEFVRFVLVWAAIFVVIGTITVGLVLGWKALTDHQIIVGAMVIDIAFVVWAGWFLWPVRATERPGDYAVAPPDQMLLPPPAG